MEPADESPERPSTGDDTVIVNPQELLGCTFLMDTQEDGQRFRAHIVECISDHESNVRCSDDHVKFQISVNEDEYEETITYNELLDFRLMVGNAFDNVGTELLAILLSVHEEGASQQFLWVNNNRVVSSGRMFRTFISRFHRVK
jgi:hypothetical protein